ncbi:class I SAM-dependent methyltransferase [Allocoleopsis franciscana]|uniref:Methylase involved in ubiquinone/menaquinone biosynthesis n=1 Tax=Allocoleopsis franciscana PCC 7113 TaxID=1173027 RepID=K9WKG6_9CYAN|nr:class I SAM-dependent methyltransferase [Allocoleopsis franciscana]AFZ20905.1 methylase involved in ubiquinone/menaquinone biosynthesis [Allocoleopsis franciscana PCC 7113]
MENNIDLEVVEAFGDEWTRFDQSQLSESDQIEMFNSYFRIFPWSKLPNNAVGFDLGCGSGRWAKLVAPRVGRLDCIDPSTAALEVAKKNLSSYQNCQFHLASVDSIPLKDESADFGYALGVLHHIPNTETGIKCCVSKLKKGAPFLLYLYYRFDNRSWWFRQIWQASEMGRFFISRLPYAIRYFLSQIIALIVYLPLARTALILEKLGFDVDAIPLSFYRHRSFYVMRTDALDRFGTKLEKRFTKTEISQMMERAGLENLVFSDRAPYWCAVGYRK